MYDAQAQPGQRLRTAARPLLGESSSLVSCQYRAENFVRSQFSIAV